jgi:hypothetical protein
VSKNSICFRRNGLPGPLARGFHWYPVWFPKTGFV